MKQLKQLGQERVPGWLYGSSIVGDGMQPHLGDLPATMLDCCAGQHIAPRILAFPMSKINKACGAGNNRFRTLLHMRDEKPTYPPVQQERE